MNKVKIIALFGKAGSGKDTILRALVNKFPDRYNEIVSCTTRPPREGEQEGVNYHFLTVEQFTEKVLNGDMLEATEFNNWHYGTALSSLSTEKINVGVFNPEGIRCLMEDNFVDLIAYYVQVGDKERLIRQLIREVDPDVKEIIRRFSADEKDFEDLEDIDYQVIINQDKNDVFRAVDLIAGQFN